jgi:membrane protease YdiL (CAAX protease family)
MWATPWPSAPGSAGRARALRELPLAVWALPWIGVLVLPLVATSPDASRLGTLFAALLMGLPALLGTPRPLRRELFPFVMTARMAAGTALAAGVVTSLYLCATWITQRLWPLSATSLSALRHTCFPDSGAHLVLVLTTLLLVTPLMEEVFFRGVLRAQFALSFPALRVLGPALLFALLHGEARNVPALFFLGLLLGFLRERSGSLAPCVLVHAVVNAAGWWWLWRAASTL